MKLEQFEEVLCQRNEMRQARRQLISKTILESPEMAGERLQANRAFQRGWQRSRICRRMLGGLHDVYWDTRSALHLEKLMKCIP